MCVWLEKKRKKPGLSGRHLTGVTQLGPSTCLHSLLLRGKAIQAKTFPTGSSNESVFND